MMSSFSISSLFAGLLFSAIGFWVFRYGKSKGDLRLVVLGILLIGYSYFTPNPWYDWGIGSLLCLATYKIWN